MAQIYKTGEFLVNSKEGFSSLVTSFYWQNASKRKFWKLSYRLAYYHPNRMNTVVFGTKFHNSEQLYVSLRSEDFCLTFISKPSCF